MVETGPVRRETPAGAILLETGAGLTLTAAQTRTTFKVTSAATGDRFSMAEYWLPHQFPGPPPHVHRLFEHAWYILEGQVLVQIGEQSVTAYPGAFVFIPAGIAHTFSNPHNAPARMLAIDTPGGFEAYYEELSAAFPGDTTVDPVKIVEIQRRYDTYPTEF